MKELEKEEGGRAWEEEEGNPCKGKRDSRRNQRSQVGIWEPHLFETHELGVVKDEKDAEDEEPGYDVEHKAEEGHPGGPWLSPSLPQHRASGYGFPVSHHQLGKDERLGIQQPIFERPRPRSCPHPRLACSSPHFYHKHHKQIFHMWSMLGGVPRI